MSEQLQSIIGEHVAPFVLLGETSTSLHFNLHELQSRMCNSQPEALMLDYTKTMMGFLLLHRRPKHIVMIGLGGGSLAKFCYQNLHETKITVVEINPHVIALRQTFKIPADDERFEVIEADGADFLRQTDSKFDVVLVDGFDHQGQPAQLCTQGFYDDCFGALTGPGIMVVNLHDTHALYELFIGRIDLTFDGNFAEIEANPDGNVIVFAGKDVVISPHNLRCHMDAARSAWSDQVSLNVIFQIDQIDRPSPASSTVCPSRM